MINPLKFHDNLWSIGLASMFNWSVRQQNGGGNNNCSDDMEDINSQRGVSEGGVSSLANLDNSSRFHFHFPSNLLQRTEEITCSSIKEKLMKQAGGKSFTIDSLLGITNAAHQAIQNCILPQHACRSSDKGQYEQVKESRYSPYFNSRKERVPLNLGSSSMLASEKCGEKSQKCSRRTAKSKRVRTIFTPEQLERLEAEFERQQYMVGPERLYLASSLYLTEAQVKVWFQNRRIKWRKQHLEMQQQRVAVFRSKQSGMESEECEDYEEGSDSSTSVTLPPSDIPNSSANLALMTTFSGSLLQDSLNCPSKEVLSELNLSQATNSFPPTRKSIPSDSPMYSTIHEHSILSK